MPRLPSTPLFSRRAIFVTVAALAVPVAGTAAVTAAAAAPASVLPHLRLVRSFPAKDTVLAKSPDAVRLWLSETAELPSAKITMANTTGLAVTLAKPTLAADKGAPIIALVPAPLPAGPYTVSWRAMSKDGHVVQGTFAFRVMPPAE